MDFCVIAAGDFSWLSPEWWGYMLQMACGLGVVIFVHELGHFLVAKWCGVKCEKFYIGFDVPFGRFINWLMNKEGEFKIFGVGIPKTIGWPVKWGETEYGIGIVPLGGYVKMLGQDDNPANAEKEAERTRIPKVVENNEGSAKDAVSATGNHVHHESVTDVNLEPQPLAENLPYEVDPRSYTAKSVPQRMAIISAGVIMNVIFAVIFATIAYRIGVPYNPAVIGGTSPGGPAWQIDLPRGAQVLRVGENGQLREEMRFGQDMAQEIMMSGDDQDLQLLIRRHKDAEPETIYLRPVKKDPGMWLPKLATIGVRPEVLPTLADKDPLQEGLPAAEAKVKLGPGDRIVAGLVDGQESSIANYGDLHAFLARYADQTVTLRAERTTKDAAGKPHIELIESTIAPRPLMRLGLAMTMGPVTAIQIGSPALDARVVDDPQAEPGFRKGDVLLAVDGEPIGDPLVAPDIFRGRAGEEVIVTVLRNSAAGKSKEVKLRVTPRAIDDFQVGAAEDEPVLVDALGLTYAIDPVIAAIDARSGAREKLKPGDTIVKVQFVPAGKTQQERAANAKILEKKGTPVAELDLTNPRFSWTHAFFALQGLPAEARVKLTFLREGKQDTIELAPFADTEHYFAVRGMQLHLVERIHKVDNWPEAFSLGLRATGENLMLVVRFLKKLFTKELSPFAFGGPLSIGVAATHEAAQGPGSLLMFLTLLSANLAVVNFLPIPMLDGGHMLFLAYEGIRRRPLPEAWQIRLSLLGFAFILCLMAFVLGLDILRFSGAAN